MVFPDWYAKFDFLFFQQFHIRPHDLAVNLAVIVLIVWSVLHFQKSEKHD